AQPVPENLMIFVVSSATITGASAAPAPAAPAGNVSSAATSETCVFGANFLTMRPMWLDSFTAASRRLQAMPRGWDGPGSVPPSRVALFRAERITRDALMDQ